MGPSKRAHASNQAMANLAQVARLFVGYYYECSVLWALLGLFT